MKPVYLLLLVLLLAACGADEPDMLERAQTAEPIYREEVRAAMAQFPEITNIEFLSVEILPDNVRLTLHTTPDIQAGEFGNRVVKAVENVFKARHGEGQNTVIVLIILKHGDSQSNINASISFQRNGTELTTNYRIDTTTTTIVP